MIEHGELGDTIDLLLPNATATLSQNPRYMWNFTSVPQTNLNGRKDKGYAAAVVGGSSSVNGMFMDRPSQADLYVKLLSMLDGALTIGQRRMGDAWQQGLGLGWVAAILQKGSLRALSTSIHPH